MAGTGSSMVARRQHKTPEICANVIPSVQPLAIQKNMEVARQIATVSADSDAMPMSRCGAGI